MQERLSALAEAAAAELLAVYGLAHEPAVAVRHVAAYMGASVREDDIIEDGRLERSRGNVTVWLRASDAEERQRFTLAHELGHLAFGSACPDMPAFTRARKRFRSEEQFCNQFAGALLLPSATVRAVADGKAETLETVSALARVGEVSLSAALLRLREVSGWNGTLLQWSYEDHKWIFDAQAGVATNQQGLLRSSVDTEWALSWWRSKDQTALWDTLPLRYGAQDVSFNAQIWMRTKRAIALITLPDESLPRERLRTRVYHHAGPGEGERPIPARAAVGFSNLP